MGTPGPPGAYDPHKFFRGSPQSTYPSEIPGYQPSSPGSSFHSHSYTPGSIPTIGFPPNTSMYPGGPGLKNPYNSTQFKQAGSPVYHGTEFGHYTQDHSPRQDPHFVSQFSQQSSLPSSPSHSNPPRAPISSVAPPPPPMFPQSRSSHTSSLPQEPGMLNPALSQALDGARLMALLATQSEGEGDGANAYEETVCISEAPPNSPRPPLYPFRQVGASHGTGTEVSGAPQPMSPASSTAPRVTLLHSSVQGRQASKIPRGRHLSRGDHAIYDVDARKDVDAQAQLDVSPITVYSSETTLALGSQIAVSREFVCYGLRGGPIRILNINNSQRVLLRGHTQRVTDMAFSSEEQPILASASQDGRIFVRRIVEGHGEDGKLTEQLLLALHLLGNWEKCHPRLCWHSQRKDLLVVAIGKFVVVIDLVQVATLGGFNVDVPMECRVESPETAVRGAYVIWQHNDDVTELASCASGATSLASASKDGTVRMWSDKRQSLAFEIVPHNGHSVDAVTFLPSPRGTDGHVLLTGGPFNRELKLWVFDNQSTRSGHGHWQCIQTLEFQSNGKPEIAFFNNQVAVSSRANLILLANAKRNTIYAVHFDFASPSAGPRVDYLTEFGMQMPVLSLTVADDGISESGEGFLKIFCLQTHVIQQFTVEMSQCLPNLMDGLPVDGFSPNAPKKGVGMMPATGTQAAPPYSLSPTFPASDKAHVRPMTNPTRTELSNITSLSSSSGIPPRPAALGNLTDLAHPGQVQVSASDTKRALDSSISSMLRDSKEVGGGKPSSPGAHSMLEAGRQTANRLMTRPDPPKEVLTSSNLSKPPTPPPRRRLWARNLAKTEIHYNPISAGLSRYKAENIEERKEVLRDTKAFAESAQPSFSSNSTECGSGVHEDKETVSSISTGNSVIKQPTSPQLISPSDIMCMAADSKREDTSDQDSRLDLMNVSDSQDGTKLRNVTASTNRMTWPSEDLVPYREDLGDLSNSPLYGSAEGLGGIGKECFGNLLKSGPVAADWHGRGGGKEDQDGGFIEDWERPPHDHTQDQLKNTALKLERQLGNIAAGLHSPVSSVLKGRKSKNKSGGAANVPLPTSSSATSSVTISSGEVGSNATPNPIDLIAQVSSMRESIFQLIEVQRELQNQIIATVANPVGKEGKQLEGVLGQRLEKIVKANVDSMWVRLAEENAKREQQEHRRMLQITALFNDFSAKDLSTALELSLKKEVAAIGASISQTLVVPVQNAVTAALTDCFQKNLNEKVFPQIEKVVISKLEATMTKQLKFQFQTYGKQSLQDGIRAGFESLIIPAFERSCQTMFDHVNRALQTEVANRSFQVQQEFALTHKALATYQDSIAEASSYASSLNEELVQSMNKLLRVVKMVDASGERNQHNNNLPLQVHPLLRVEEPLDPTLELNTLIRGGMMEEAFNKALIAGDLQIVFWLCNQLDPVSFLSADPLPVSQGVLLSLIQQLSSELSMDTALKLRWIKEATLVLNPRDPVVGPHMRSFLDKSYQNCHHQMRVSKDPSEHVTLRLIVHVINSLLSSCN